jgi:hypothetical protein
MLEVHVASIFRFHQVSAGMASLVQARRAYHDHSMQKLQWPYVLPGKDQHAQTNTASIVSDDIPINKQSSRAGS